MKFLKIGSIAILSMALLYTACKKDEDSNTGDISVRMTDAPGDYLEVNVEVKEVQVHYASSDSTSGWVTLNTNSGIYNLLELQNDVSVLLATEQELQAGAVNQMRIILGTNNEVMLTDSSTTELTVNSAINTGLKLNVNSEIRAGAKTEILIDFDADKSIVSTGENSFLLKPVITVESVSYTEL